ncbi:hypothetical protein DVS77_21535 [Mycolicibacterium moriokaense]|nr:hypothetical protein DVS77_21535 [Mycolicibacterium moriokaense]
MNYITTANEAELNAEKVMRSWGYLDAKATTGGSDGGIDVRSRAAIAQVKWRNGMAGRPDLQRLFGARGRDATKDLFFFAASGYTKTAITYARDVGIYLFVFDPTGAVKRVNGTELPRATGRQYLPSASQTIWSVIIIIGLVSAVGLMILTTKP